MGTIIKISKKGVLLLNGGDESQCLGKEPRFKGARWGSARGLIRGKIDGDPLKKVWGEESVSEGGRGRRQSRRKCARLNVKRGGGALENKERLGRNRGRSLDVAKGTKETGLPH